MPKETFIPLSQANNSYLNEDRLRVNLSLPYGLNQSVEINPRRMDTVRQIAGFSRIIIVQDDKSEASQITLQNDGVNPDSTITSYTVETKSVPENTFRIEDSGDIDVSRASWPELKISLNIGKISERLLRNQNGNIEEPTVWSRELNKIVKNTITLGGIEHLLSTKDDFVDRFVGHLFYFVNVPFAIIGGNYNKVCSLFSKLFFDMINLSHYGFENKDRGYRLSLTLGVEPERAIALSIYSRLGKLIRERSE